MKLETIRIVLVETSHPGNIGSSARAMKTMGLQELYLVNPKHPHDLRAIEMAAGADDILNQAHIVSSLQEALDGCELVIGTSARPRGIGLTPLTPRACAETIATRFSTAKVAIVFGREYAGLTNEELLFCHFHMNIPSAEAYSSLNLSQAVQIMAYELRVQALNPQVMTELRKNALASADEVELFFNHLEQVLIDVDFLKLNNPRRLMPRLRRLFSRVILEKMEVNILRGMLKHIHRGLKRNS
jgi:tRNA (cytidine32/uridine32-2'-O)-methyltransferase